MNLFKARGLEKDIDCRDTLVSPRNNTTNIDEETTEGVVLCREKLQNRMETVGGQKDDYCTVFNNSRCPLTSRREAILRVETLDIKNKTVHSFDLGKPKGRIDDTGSAVKFRPIATDLPPVFVHAIRAPDAFLETDLDPEVNDSYIAVSLRKQKDDSLISGQSQEGIKICTDVQSVQTNEPLTFPVEPKTGISFFNSFDTREKEGAEPVRWFRLGNNETKIKISKVIRLVPR